MPFNNIINRVEATPLIPEEVTREIFQTLPETSVVMSLARRLPNMQRGQLRLPIMSLLPTATIGTGVTQQARDTELIQTTEANWINKFLYAEQISSIVVVPNTVIADQDYDLWGQIIPSIQESIGKAFDQAVLYGIQAPIGTWPTDLLAGATAAGNSVVLGTTGSDLYDDIMSNGGLLSKVENDGFGVTGHIGSLSLKAKLRSVRSTQGDLIFTSTMQDRAVFNLDGSPVLMPKNGAMIDTSSLLFSGDWSQLVYSIREDVNIFIANQGVIQDATGTIQNNLFQQNATALRVVFRIGWQLPNPVNRVNPTEGTRYPFSVLKPV